VAEAGHPFKTLTGLVQEFGTERIIDTPISEPGYAGIGVGAAMTGMRPVVDVMFGDFITFDDRPAWSTRPPRRTTCRAARSRCRAHRRHKRLLSKLVAPLPASAGGLSRPAPQILDSP
jgi:hypothetical protein